MKLNVKLQPTPYVGQHKIVRKFMWFPLWVEHNSVWKFRWLCMATCEYRYTQGPIIDDGCSWELWDILD